MVWTFNPADVKAVDLRDAKPGDFLCSLRAAKEPERWLRLSGDATECPMLNLTGSNAMVVWNVQPQGALPTLRIAEGATLKLEIDDSEGVSRETGNVGDLLIADSGAYFVGIVRNQGFSDACCISLATWKAVGLHEVSNIRAAFKSWRLVDNTVPKEKQALLSFGVWS